MAGAAEQGSVDVGDISVAISYQKEKGEHSVYPERDGIACKLAPAESCATVNRHGAVKIRFSNICDGLTNEPAISVMQYMQDAVDNYGDRTALKVERGGQWISWTYKEYLQEIRTVGKAFLKLGLEVRNSVGILGFNSPEWLFAELGAIFAGGFACGIYTTNNAETCQFIASDAACNILVVENDLQLQKMLSVWGSLPQLKCIIQYTGELKEKKANLYTWKELMEIGRKEDDTLLNERIKDQAPNRCCCLIYTSGTTGNPKGVMLSHDNVISALKAVAHVIKPWVAIDPTSNQQEVCISYLPLSHIAAQMTDIWIPMYAGACVWFARSDALKGSLTETLKAARPTLFVGVPRVYEKIEEKLKSIGANIHGVKRKLADWAKDVALRGNRNKIEGKPVPYGWKLAHLLVLRRIHKALGLDRAKLVFTAAAPISKQTLEYFQSLDVPLLELYGMSESSGAITINTPSKVRLTSIGPIMGINEYKVANPDEDGSGELWFRGRNVFMGYLNNEEKMRETMDDDGWLHSGDVGKVDENGFFYITGRIKELIITAGGENIAPVPIEERIKEQLPLVSQAMVIGDKKKFLSVLLTLQVQMDISTGLPTDQLCPIAISYCKELGLNVTKAQEIAPDVPEALSNAIQAGIDAANKKAVSGAAKVQKWKLLPLDFTTAGGELGPTQKLRRPHVVKMYAETIEDLYNVPGAD